MRVRVTLYGELARYIPGGHQAGGGIRAFDCALEDSPGGPGTGATVDTLLDRLGVPTGTPAVIGVNGTVGERATALRDGDEVTLLSPITGGATSGAAPQVY